MRHIFILLVFIALYSYGSPIKSMIGAERSGYLPNGVKPFPEGVVPVEYLESTGGQYIDIGIVLSSGSSIEWIVQVVRYNDGCMGLYETSTGGRMCYINFYANKLYPRYSSFAPSSSQLNPEDGWITFGKNHILFSNGSIVINDTIAYSGVNTSGLDSMTKTMILFAYRRVSTITGFSQVRVYAFRIKTGDTNEIDMCPVRVGDVGAMYDTVSEELFYNQGSGEFLIGPDKE